MDATRMFGQHLVMGFEGTIFPKEAKDIVRQWKIANVILFAHNIASKFQLKALCEDIQQTVLAATGERAFITIDQEGGVVSRLKEDCAIVPSAMGLSASGDPDNAYQAGLLTGRELSALGVNFNLAPVYDVNSNEKNPVIGVRSYADRPQTAAVYANAFAKGLLDAGVLCCGKHFPGHGDTAVDSHLGLPTVNKSKDELMRVELAPFIEAIRMGIPGIMSTHILFPQLEKNNVPATMSRAIMTDLLKKELGFDGLVLSDCMMMGAIARHYGTVNGMVEALKAGVDLIFSSHSMQNCVDAVRAMQQALDKGEISLAELETSTQKILRYKRALQDSALPLDAVGGPEHRAIQQKLYLDSLTLVSGELPPKMDNPLFVSPPPFVVTLASNPAVSDMSFARSLQAALGGESIVLSTNPAEEEIDSVVRAARNHDALIIGTYNGHIYKGQEALVRRLAALGIPTVVFALRNPYDVMRLPQKVCGIALYAYNDTTIALARKILKKEVPLTGKLPVAR